MLRSLGNFLKGHTQEAWLVGAGIILAVVILLVFGLGVRLYHRETMQSWKTAQLEKVRVARSALRPCLQELQSGRIDREEAIEQARVILRSLTYQDEFGPNYFFMNRLDGTILVRPFSPQDEGVRKLEFRDAHGHPRLQEILPWLKAHPDGLFLTYYFPNPRDGKDEEKLSCFQLIPELDVMIGTGAFMNEAARSQARLLHIGMVISIGVMLLYLVPVALSVHSLRRHNRQLHAEVQERLRAEQNLIEERLRFKDLAERLRVTLDAVDDALISLNTAHQIRAMNPVAEGLTGWGIQEAAGRPIEEVFSLLAASDHKPLGLPISRTLETGESVKIPLALIINRSMGKPIEVSGSCSPVRNHLGEIVGAILVFRDITEENRNREELAHAQRMDAIGQLAGGVAHDFNNMLSGILGIAEYLQESDLPKQEHDRHLSKIVEACRRAADLSSKLLAFARKGKIESTAINLHGSIESAIALLKRTIDKRVEIRTQFGAEDCHVIGDGSMLMNAFLNLAINAQHAMPEGGRLRFATWNTHLCPPNCQIGLFDVSPGSYLVAEVSDTGTGIAPTHLPHIFEPYFTTKEAGKGTGLGLAAVYGIMKQHHGAIEVDSTLGIGTTFRLYFPTAEIRQNPSEDGAKPICGKGTLLLIDDEELIRHTAKAILERLGYQVLLAADGSEGVAVFDQHRGIIDLVILDMIMPRMNGRECFRKIRELSPDIPVILASGFSQSSDLAELHQAGISDFLRKPFNTLDLSKAVEAALKRRAD